MHCDFLFPRLWRHNFWTYLSYQANFVHDQKVKTNIEIFWERKEHLKWNKKHFHRFKGLSVAKNCFRLESAPPSKKAAVFIRSFFYFLLIQSVSNIWIYMILLSNQRNAACNSCCMAGWNLESKVSLLSERQGASYAETLVGFRFV